MSGIDWLLYVLVVACAAVGLAYGLTTRRLVLAEAAGSARMQRDRGRHPGRRHGLSEPAVHDHRRSRRGGVHRALDLPGLSRRLRLPARRRALGLGRLHRHDRIGAGERAHRRGRAARTRPRAGRGVSRWRHHGAPGRGARPARSLRLLRHPGAGRPGDPLGARGPRRPVVRRVSDLDLRPPRRRHFHQRGRCRGRSGRQDRGRHPGGRSAQSRGDRGQRGRQRRRLCRHGGGPVRDLCRHRGRDHAARRHLLHRERPDHAHALPAPRRRRLPARLGDRHLPGQARAEPQHHGGAVQGLSRRRGRLGGGADPDHAVVPGRQHRLHGRRRQLHRLGRVRLHAGRPAGHRLSDVDHRLLHRHQPPAGAEDRAKPRPPAMPPTSSRASRSRWRRPRCRSW